MKTNHDLPSPDRVAALARRAGMERSLYIGETIGHMLQIAGGAFEALGAAVRRAIPRGRRLN